MKRIILDTSVYGLIVKLDETDYIKERTRKKKSIVLCGFSVVRKELNDTPRKKLSADRSLRFVLVGLYDRVTKERYDMTKAIIRLAEDYYTTYEELGGNKSRQKILNDFLIIACASIKEMDVVVSEDRKTMLSEISIKAYKIVNKIKKLRTPDFYSYEEFRRLLL